MAAANTRPSAVKAKVYHLDTFTARNLHPLRIALLGYRSHPHVGGQGIYLKYLSRALSGLGHRVDVISGPPYPELDDNITLIKVPSLNLFAQENHVTALRLKHLKSYTNAVEWWSMLTGGFSEPYTFGRRVKKIIADTNYDIIHDNQSLSYGLIDLQKRGHNVVSTIHHPIHMDRKIALKATEKWGSRLLIKRWYSFLRMQEKVVKRLDNVITVSRTSQRDIHQYFMRTPSQTPIISNGIDTRTFRPLANIKREPFRLITTSSSDQPLKGLVYLLQAVARLKAFFPNIHLRVIGRLKENGDTKKLLEELKLEDSVSFVSGISTQELVQHYAGASLMVCPSLYEGFGLPAGEAMACELPIIASNGGALPEVVGDAGVIVEAGNVTMLAEKIALLFRNQTLAQAYGKQARLHILKHFSWDRVALSLTDYYQSILNRVNG